MLLDFDDDCGGPPTGPRLHAASGTAAGSGCPGLTTRQDSRISILDD
jgi:hypothetical protein